MAYPLEIPGVIVVDSKKKWVFTDKEKKILAHFAAVASNEVEREKRLREMEEEREGGVASATADQFLSASPGRRRLHRGDREGGPCRLRRRLALAGVERKGKLSIVCRGGGRRSVPLGAECPMQMTIASAVMEGGREFLLPYESGYLREKPLLFPNDGIRARQYFGFPLMVDERPFGFLGFVSLSSRPLRERSISALRDTAALMSLSLGRMRMQEEMERWRSGTLRRAPWDSRLFFDGCRRKWRGRRKFFRSSP